MTVKQFIELVELAADCDEGAMEVLASDLAYVQVLCLIARNRDLEVEEKFHKVWGED